ncbi:hypothetical protein [Paracoccus rhizosphaerae]|uniref:ABC transporter n=1 Tax=Paracoccus rhizosphaerae TaxID=1133347 RepID=A0ABV6CTG9_9RHOB|nr:hypothetical protein [Paracoccus rhizosphaerae]
MPRLDRVTGRCDPARLIIHDLTLTLKSPKRLVIGGANGGGKSTLPKIIRWSARVSLDVTWALLDQHLGLLQPDGKRRKNFLRLKPACDQHEALARFGFRAVAALRAPAT